MHPLGVVPETAVGCLHRRGSERDILDCCFFLTRTGRAWSSEVESSGGTLSAPTGCSPRDYCRSFTIGSNLKNLDSGSFFVLGVRLSLLNACLRDGKVRTGMTYLAGFMDIISINHDMTLCRGVGWGGGPPSSRLNLFISTREWRNIGVD